MIVEQIKRIVDSGTVIPKPYAKADYVVRGWGESKRGDNPQVLVIFGSKYGRCSLFL